MRIFGYGSLVNRHTHGHAPAEPLTLAGWHRVWVHSRHRPVAILSVEPAPGAEIDGLVLPVAEADRPALYEREAAYDLCEAAPGIGIFAVSPERHPPADAAHPVRLSYLDVVVQGYLAEFGAEGVARFFATTSGWDAPVLDDRAAPLYARARTISEVERGLTDRHLAALGAKVRR